MAPLNRFELYTLCVQDPPRLARFLVAVHGGSPRILRDDFSGAAGIGAAWIDLSSEHRAIAVDMDFGALRRARRDPRLALVLSDVRRMHRKADIIAAINFPVGYWHERADLVKYLALSRKRLLRGGVFICDMYGGRDAFTPCTTGKRVRGPRGEKIIYEWEQREADAATGLVHNAIHFRVTARGAQRAKVHRDAFTYHWRLWSIPELKDAMREAGFGRIDVYSRMGDAIDSDGRVYVRPLDDGEPLDDHWVVYIAARR